MNSIRSFFTSIARITLFFPIILLLQSVQTPEAAGQTEYVIVISVDGGGAGYIQNLVELNQLPNFKRFQTQGAWTNNARNDYDYTITLPNHVSIVTGLGIIGVGGNGHQWTGNVDPSNIPTASDYSIQNNKGAYIPSVFDVAHDNGLRTALYATKTKFSLFDHSYNNNNGAPDTTNADNGLNKIDAYVYDASSLALVSRFSTAMTTNPFNYSLVHFTDGDTAGHASGWGSPEYNNALIAVDGYLGQLFDLVTSDPALQGKTCMILTADHGGNATNHANSFDPLNYTIPFYIWGPDIEAGKDLYTINQSSRLAPSTGHPSYADPIQPIRHGDSANLALIMLGLGAIPGSTINPSQGLNINSSLPDTGINGHPNDLTFSTSATFTFNSSNTDATFECRLNVSSWATCFSGTTYNNLGIGSHTFQVRAKDTAGNTDATPAWFHWNINGSVKIGSNNYSSLTTALTEASNGATLKLLASIAPEGLTYAGNGLLSIEGGYDGGWNRQPDLFSPVISIVITSGTLIVDQIVAH